MSLQLSDMSFALDFQKRGGYMHTSRRKWRPTSRNTKAARGLLDLGRAHDGGIAYNPKLVSADEAPKTWKDMLDPKWTERARVKVSISGLQHVDWYVLRRLYGNDFWQKLAPLKPHAFDSYVQQFDRLVNGQDKVIAYRAVFRLPANSRRRARRWSSSIPPDGLVAAPQPWGMIKEAPHPAAAQLFMDWFLGVPGQTGNGEVLYLPLAARDVPPPPGGVSLNEFKLLFPTDWHALHQTHAQFVARVGQDHRPALSRSTHSRPEISRQIGHAAGRAAVRRAGALSDRLPDRPNRSTSAILGSFRPRSSGFDNYTQPDRRLRASSANTAAGRLHRHRAGGAVRLPQAWILTRTEIPGRERLERLMELPYYMTPLIGALAWGVLLGPKTGLVNQVWRSFGCSGDLFNIYSPYGIAWVMALFEGTVAFVMISAAMKSMDPSLEESSRVLGAGKLRTALRITLPMVAPGVLSATIFVFAEMLGSFAAAFVLGIPGPFLSSSPPRSGRRRCPSRRTTAAPRRWACRCSASC